MLDAVDQESETQAGLVECFFEPVGRRMVRDRMKRDCLQYAGRDV